MVVEIEEEDDSEEEVQVDVVDMQEELVVEIEVDSEEEVQVNLDETAVVVQVDSMIDLVNSEKNAQQDHTTTLLVNLTMLQQHLQMQNEK
jgi:hypothetical protein